MNIITMIVQIILVAIIVGIKTNAQLYKIKLTYDFKYNQYEGYKKEKLLHIISTVFLNICIFFLICTVIYMIEDIAIFYIK